MPTPWMQKVEMGISIDLKKVVDEQGKELEALKTNPPQATQNHQKIGHKPWKLNGS